MFLITEFVNGMPLNEYTKKKFSTRSLPELELRLIGRDLMRAVHQMHQNNIYHRDIKMENILISKTKNVKLIDLGFSIQAVKQKLKLFCGTPSYMSPEIVLKKEYRGGPADVWAIAVVLFAIHCGAFPFKSPIERELYRKITKGLYTFPLHVSSSFKRVIDQMLSSDASHRPTCDDLLKDPFFNLSDTEISSAAKKNTFSSLAGRSQIRPCTINYQPLQAIKNKNS